MLTDVKLCTSQPDCIHKPDFSDPSLNHVIIVVRVICNREAESQSFFFFLLAKTSEQQQSECLKDAFNELDWSSPEVTVLLSPSEPYFRVSTAGPAGSWMVVGVSSVLFFILELTLSVDRLSKRL